MEENPQAIKIKTRLTANGYLVLLDTYYPGWTATVDGAVSPVYRADTVGRAVFVPSGEHVVSFVYQPASFYAGVGLALFATVTLTLLWFYPRRRRWLRLARLDSQRLDGAASS